MNRLVRWIVGGAMGVALVGAASAPVWTASAARAQEGEDLPTAEAVFDRFVEVTGGRAAYEGLGNRVSSGTMSIPAQGISGTITVMQAPPNKMVNEVEFGGIGKSRSGFNGEVAWESNQMMGPRVLQGAEAAQAKRSAVFNPELHWRDLYQSAETVGVEEVDGEKAYKLDLVSTDGQEVTQFYSKDSGLLLRSTTTVTNQMGQVPVVTKIVEWKEFDGIKVPVKTTISMTGVEMVISVDEVKHNADLPADAFALPEEVQKLVDAGKGG